MYDYFFFAGLATATLFTLGFIASRRSWFMLGSALLILLGWSSYTAQWLWFHLAK